MPRLSLILLAATVSLAQEPTPTPQGGPPATGPGFGAGRQPEPEIRPYDKVITKEAKSNPGIFTVHQVKSRYYYEIPVAQLGKDFLWVSQIQKTTLGAGYGGTSAGYRVVRWERHDNRVLLRNVSYDVVADQSTPISRAVKASNNDTIIMSFNVEALGKSDAPVIDVSRLFTTEVSEFSARQVLRARGFDASRSFIEKIRSFPENINVEVTQTFTAPPETPGAPTNPPVPSFTGSMRGNTGTIVMHYSMVKLPEKPMIPRLYDDRVGYFTVSQQDYGVGEHKAARRTYITRWRLEKKDPSAALSEPVKPITYYVDPATPTQWVPYIKKGIEAWQPAFEAAGFKRAIVAAEAPKNDPDWSPEDARYSVVRWLPSTIQNAVGPHVHDPRTGEILEADIQMYHNIQQLQRDWYFTQVGHLDKRAQRFPVPDDLMGELIAYVVAHEVGHTLGFQHNMKSSSLYPFEKLRDKEWLHKMGHTASIMDYSRFNYLVQPEDGVDLADLIPRVGPYDTFATMWGYKPIPGTAKAEDERSTLNEWLKVQDTTPWLRFSTSRSFGSDPGENTEAVGDADAIQATTLGTKNIKRVLDLILPAATKAGENYDDVGALYSTTLGQWTRELNHVAALVGGFNSQQKHGGQDGLLFTPVPRERQQAAVKFLNATVFATPTWALKKEILRRVEPNGGLARILNVQRSVLTNLLSNSRMQRLQEQEVLDGAGSYRQTDFLKDVRDGVFSELTAATPQIEAPRRNLQRAYLDLINDKLNGRQTTIVFSFPGAPAPPPNNANDDTRGLLRAELHSISALAAAKLKTTADRATVAHLEDMRDQIAKILDPKFAPPAPPTGGLMGRFSMDDSANPETCWPDLSIDKLPFDR